MANADPETNAAADAMERLRTSYERSKMIDASGRLQVYLDGLSLDEDRVARSYIGQPVELMLVKIALRLEEHITTTNHLAAAVDHSHSPWRGLGMAIGSAVAGAVAATAAVREALR